MQDAKRAEPAHLLVVDFPCQVEQSRVVTSVWYLPFAGIPLALMVACGARSALDDGSPPPSASGGGVPFIDAGHDASGGGVPFPDAGRDASDGGTDASDGSPDASDGSPDASDGSPDAAPPVCVDAGITYIYVLTEDRRLLSYYPPDGSFHSIGTIECPDSTGPYSMAVDRSGTAYVVYNDGHLFRVNTATAACEATSFIPNQHGFLTFGMGFAANAGNPGETLYVAEGSFYQPSAGLATIDMNTLELSFIGPFSPSLQRGELTGTGNGRLFAFSRTTTVGSYLSEIDPATAAVFTSTPVAIGDANSAFAFAYWGGDFYFFTGNLGSVSTITRYDAATGSRIGVGSAPGLVVGAGVSTCAPNG